MLCLAGICLAGSTSVNIATKPTADWFKNGGQKDLGWRWMQEADALLAAGGGVTGGLGTGTVFYVDSGVTNAGDGSNWNNAKATIEEAYDLCTANAGDVILVAQGHSETLGTLVLDTEGVTIVGIGAGEDRPEIVFNGTGDIITISGASNTLVNLSFRAGVSAIVTGINITADGDYTTIAYCDFPEPATSTFEFATAIQLATGSDNVTIQDCTYSHIATTGPDKFIDGGASVLTGLRVIGNTIAGEFAVAPIFSDQIDTNVLIKGNVITNMTTGQYAIEYSAAATGFCTDNRLYTDTATTTLDPGSMKCAENYNINAIDLSAVLVPPVPAIATVTAGSADDILKKLYYGSDGTGAYPATLANDSALAMIMAKGATATPSTYSNTTDSLEAIRDNMDTLNAADQVDLDAILAKTGYYYVGTASTNVTTTTVISTGLTGFGDAFFVTDWVMICTYDAGGAAGAPEGEVRDITAYTSTTGTFTVAAFSAAVTVGDKVMVMRREAVGLFNFAAGTGNYPTGVLDDSPLAYILGKGATASASTYVNTTDSLEMLSDKLGAFAGTAGAAVGESLYADIALAQVDLDAILLDTAAMDTAGEVQTLAGTANISTTGVTGAPTANTLADTLHKDGNFTYDNTTDSLEAIADVVESSATKTCTAAGSLANGTNNVFAIAGGPVEVISLVGIVTNELKTVANACKFIHTTTSPAGSVDLTSAVECSADAAGTSYTLGATVGAALVPTTAGTIGSSALTFIAPVGTIGFNAAGTFDASDSITFYIRYKPLVSGARVTAAP